MSRATPAEDANWSGALRELRPTQRRFRVPDDWWTAAYVPDIVDGDTIDLCVRIPCVDHELVYRARLLGVNAPETHTRDAEEKRAGLASADYLRTLLRAQRVVAHIRGSDMYGRLLVHIFLPRATAFETEADDADVWWRVLLRAIGISYFDDAAAAAAAASSTHAIRLHDMLHVNDDIVRAGHAVRYDGKGKRAPWTTASPLTTVTSPRAFA